MWAQSSLSHRLAAGGQQSCIGSDADISVASCDVTLNAAAPAAGSMATERAIRRANMVRTSGIWRGNIRRRPIHRQVTISRELSEG